MNILEAIEKKFKTHGNNVVEAIKNMNGPLIVDGEPEDEAVPTYDAANNKIGWKVPQGGGGDNRFIANARYTTETGKHFSFKECDKTAKQIIDAYKDGKDVVIYAKIERYGSEYEGVDNFVTLRVSGYIYAELGGGEPYEMLNMGSSAVPNILDDSMAMYLGTVVNSAEANISLQLIQLTTPQQS